MSLHIILGGANADKTNFCFDITQKLIENEKQVCMIVPDQFSYNAEKTAVSRFGGTGLNGFEVLTFNKIVSRIRRELNLENYLTGAGREMLICRAISDTVNADSIFYGCIEKDGFIGVISDLISEFKRYGVTYDIIRAQSSKASTAALANKLASIAAIYERYEELVGDRFSDSDNDLDVAAEYISKNKLFDGSCVIFDGFSDFLPQNMNVVEKILKNAADVYVTLNIPQNLRPNDDTFETCQVTYSTLRRIARENGIDVQDHVVPNSKVRSREMDFIVNNWNTVDKAFSEKTDKVSVFYAKNPYSEIEYTAAEIIRLVRTKGLRFRDISILCGSMDTYAHVIESVFSEYNIPYFTDETTPVTNHPIITAVTAVFDIIENNWKYEDVFRYLRSGFIYDIIEEVDKNGNTIKQIKPLNQELIDKLENYVLRWGIRGKSQWLSQKPWTRKRVGILGEQGSDEIDETLDALRLRIAAPIERLREKCIGKSTSERAASLFEFLEEIHLPDGIEYEINLLRESGFMDEASRFEKVWELLIEAIEQAYITMDGTENNELSFEEFSRYIRIGLSKCDIRIIPSSLDHVAVGTVDRSRSADVKEMFIVGANFGMIPPDMNKEGILSNSDRNEIIENLSEDNMSIAPDTKKRNTAERYKVYNSICAANDSLHISYSAANLSDDTLRPAQFVSDIKRMFPYLTELDDLVTPVDTVQSKKSAFRMLMLHLNNDNSAWGMLRRYFEQDNDFSMRIKHILSSTASEVKISSDNASKLFSSSERSVTQFERYAACPYSYFLQYGLRLRERPVWEISSIDVGNLCHKIVQDYCEAVSEGRTTLRDVHSRWHSISDEECTEILNDIISKETSFITESTTLGKGQISNVLSRIRKTVNAGIDLINKSLRAGEYAFSASEKEYHTTIGNAAFVGKIDRVDIAEHDETAYIRIIDYKSGKQDFDLAKILAGINLQLVTYAVAAKELYDNGEFLPRQSRLGDVRIGGILYNKIRDDIVTKDTAELAAAEREKQHRLSGIVFADNVDELKYIDASLDCGRQSDFIPLNLTKSGSIGKINCCCEQSSIAQSLIDNTCNVISDINSNILHGRIPIYPYSLKNSSPCTFCSFGSICRFTEGTGTYRYIPIQSTKAAKEYLDKERNNGME